MKRLIPLLFIFLFSYQAFSQDSKPTPKFEIGLSSTVGSFGLNDTFHSKTYPLCFEGCAITGSNAAGSFSIGITGRYAINQSFSIASGIAYASNSYNEEFTGSNGASFYTRNAKRQFDFLEVPVLIHADVYSLPENRISFFAETGIINNFNLTEKFPNPDSNIELNRYGISGTVSAGAKLRTKSFNIEIAPFYSHSFSSYGEDVRPSVTTQNYNPKEFRPHNMGMKFNILMPVNF